MLRAEITLDLLSDGQNDRQHSGRRGESGDVSAYRVIRHNDLLVGAQLGHETSLTEQHAFPSAVHLPASALPATPFSSRHVALDRGHVRDEQFA